MNRLWFAGWPALASFALALAPAASLSSSAWAQSITPPLESATLISSGPSVRELSLDGDWQTGLDRNYDRTLRVPGLATDPSRPTPGTLWYKRTVNIPHGSWTHATLTLNGARFAPEVYVNGKRLSAAEGGMAATVHRFPLPERSSGETITLEIALHSLKDLDRKDASFVPGADQWRNNDSSYLWDSVVLRLHGAGEIERISPASSLSNDTISLKWQLSYPLAPNASVHFSILDEQGNLLIQAEDRNHAASGLKILDLHHNVEPWSPEHPHLYRLRTELIANGQVLDALEQSLGLREFTVDGLGFRLNREPYRIRMGTVVWHRWTRDPEAKDIAFNPVWFENNVVLRLKDMGANALRFHLGLPPEKFLDLCDRDGLAVQMEWPFFHGIGASEESMKVQWQEWLDTAMRHPSVVIVHPWNETGGDQVKGALNVLNSLLKTYPPLVVAHRDLTPVHKYWWSLFENLGLYYDSASQFGQAVMVDEFGGDYLDGNGNPGGYPATKETFLRFLGRDSTREERLELQAEANARVAEYWRRLGVAGFSPFCILGSPQDGNHWFLGPTDIPSPTPKPVWRALSAAFARDSLSLELWNRNFTPSETLRTPLWFFNEDGEDQTMRASIHILDRATAKDAATPLTFEARVRAHASATVQIAMPLPPQTGEWIVEARLELPASPPAGQVISSWHIRTFVPAPSSSLQSVAIGVSEHETELREMLQQMHLHVVTPSDPSANILLGSKSTWQKLREDKSTFSLFDSRLHQGKSIVLLDVGPQPLGAGYLTGSALGGPLEGAPTVRNPAVLQETQMFGGVKVSFAETAEPESTLQQPAGTKELWTNVPRQATWLWNGLRGGLVVPAADMTVSGLSGKALLTTWEGRGADPGRIVSGNYFAYELAGYYAFADRGDDQAVSDALRKRVKFLVEDAPSLQSVINPDAPIKTTNLRQQYLNTGLGAQAEALVPLAEAGKNLGRTPVVQLSFGNGSGKLILSQLLTQGRLLPSQAQPGPGVYGLRYDPIAVQFVLNMLDSALTAR